jgi:transposase
MRDTIVCVDLAKDVIQVCVYTNNKVRSNTEMRLPELIGFFANATA